MSSAKGIHKSVGWALFAATDKISPSAVYKFFPCETSESVLEKCDALAVRVTKELAVDRVICNAHLTTVIAVDDMNNFYAVRENWETVSFQETEQKKQKKCPKMNEDAGKNP